MSAPHIGTAEDLRGLLHLAADEPLAAVVPYRGELVSSAEQARDLVKAFDLPSGTPLQGLAGALCVDGSIGSRTAALRSPYTDAQDTSGYRYLTVEQVRDHVVACTEARLQAGFHVIGDAGVDAVIEGLRLAAEVVGEAALRRSRHRLEHVEMLDDDEAWRRLDGGFQRGRKALGGVPLEDLGRRRGGTMRVYWAGAAFWLEADLALRGEHRSSLDAVLSGYQGDPAMGAVILETVGKVKAIPMIAIGFNYRF